jgi:hypothetical protein
MGPLETVFFTPEPMRIGYRCVSIIRSSAERVKYFETWVDMGLIL